MGDFGLCALAKIGEARLGIGVAGWLCGEKRGFDVAESVAKVENDRGELAFVQWSALADCVTTNL